MLDNVSEQHPKSQEDPEAVRSHRLRRRGRWFLLAMLLICLLHVSLLRAIGAALIAEPPQGEFEVAVVLGGDHRLQAAVDLIQSGRIERLWLIEARPDYVVTAGILPSEVAVLRERLIEMGVAAGQIETLIDPEVDDLPDAARLLAERLSVEADPRLLVICGALSGRHVRTVLDNVLAPQAASRVSILGLPYDRFDVNGWWLSRSGLKQIFGELCSLGFTLSVGTQPREAPPRVDPAAIEAELQRRFGESACYAR